MFRNLIYEDGHPNTRMREIRHMMTTKTTRTTALRVAAAFLLATSALTLRGLAQDVTQTEVGPPATFGSIQTPRPINPAASTTNPSARATQIANPFLGSVPQSKPTPGDLELTLQTAIDLGLRYNLGLIDSTQADQVAKAQRQRALASLLPQISARAQETFEQLSYKELGLRLPAAAGFQLPPTSGSFSYSDARIVASSSIVNVELLNRYRAQKRLVNASALNTKDSRDVIVFAVGSAYFQVVASQARLDTAQAALTSARQLDTQLADQVRADVSPEIDGLRAHVEFRTAEQKVTDASNDLEKDKLTFDRLTGLSLQQAWHPSTEELFSPGAAAKADVQQALATRADLASSKVNVDAASLSVRAARAERLPALSLQTSYGGAGVNPGNYSQVYEVTGSVSVPIFTSGRIRSDEREAQANLVQRRAEYQDLEGRVAYDVRTAQLDAEASEKAVGVAVENRALSEKALVQSKDRFANGVTNSIEVVQAQEAVVTASENYVASLFSYNVARIALARAMGSAESRIGTLFSKQ